MKVRGIVTKGGNRLFTFTTFPNTFLYDCRLKPFDSSQNNLYSEMSVDPDLYKDVVFFLFLTIDERARTTPTLVFLF